MCRATLHFVSPAGVPITLEMSKDDDQQAIRDLLARAEQIGLFYGARGWRLDQFGPSADGIDPPHLGPTFAGYPCSPTVDERGLPTWIIVDGRQAQRREKQGDVWYSVKLGEGEYDQILRIPKGERAPTVRGL